MDLQYAFDKLYPAICSLILQDLPLQERVASGWVCRTPMKIQIDDVPEQLQPQLREVQAKLAAIEHGGLVADAQSASAIAEDLLELFIDVTILLARSGDASF